MLESNAVADCILKGFVDYRENFSALTRGAKARFLQAAWRRVQEVSKERIQLYKTSKLAVADRVRSLGGEQADWSDIKRVYQLLVEARPDASLAGTFYNTIYREVTGGLLSDDVAFVSRDPHTDVQPAGGLTRRYRHYQLQAVVSQALRDNELAPHLHHLAADATLVAERLTLEIPLLRRSTEMLLEVVDTNFYRNKGAYMVGRLVVEGNIFPLAVAFRHGPAGMEVDAVLWGENRLSVVFSFTRSYFMVDVEEPSGIVSYLRTLLPEKQTWELFTSLGYFKHGKTGFVRGLRQNQLTRHDRFHVAEGIKGQIMLVFALDSYQTVFKIMKDSFPATKSVTHADVRAAYQLVKTHDRVGRMADTQEFHRLVLPRARFDDDLLDELLLLAPARVGVEGDEVVISHVYTERLMTPLNIYIRDCSEFQLEQVLVDYGHAIRELAAANIFPGDMLLKNFGVTRHGRVVFYDYDEICYLTSVNFRTLPENEGGHGSAEPWFDIGEYDVFPEEFASFLFPDEKMQSIFRAAHGELLTAQGWQAIQDQVRADVIMDVYPYPAREHLRPHGPH